MDRLEKDVSRWSLLIFCVEDGRDEPADLETYDWFESKRYDHYQGAVIWHRWSISVDPKTGIAWTWCRD